MSREDVQDFLAMVQGTYPNFNPMDKTATINAWTIALEDFDKGQVAIAFKAYMQSDTSGFAPTPGKIISKIQGMTAPQYLTETEAWALVSQAIRNSGYNAVEEYVKLPPLVQKAVGLPSQLHTWAIDEYYNEMTVSREFITAYRTIVQRQEELDKMPENIKALIAKVNESSEMAQIQDKRDKAINSALEDKEAERKALTVSQWQDMPDGVREKYEIMKKEWKDG